MVHSNLSGSCRVYYMIQVCVMGLCCGLMDGGRVYYMIQVCDGTVLWANGWWLRQLVVNAFSVMIFIALRLRTH